MTTTYHVRNYCENEEEYKRTTQTTLDDTWKAPECVSGDHTTRDFVIEEVE